MGKALGVASACHLHLFRNIDWALCAQGPGDVLGNLQVQERHTSNLPIVAKGNGELSLTPAPDLKAGRPELARGT